MYFLMKIKYSNEHEMLLQCKLKYVNSQHLPLSMDPLELCLFAGTGVSVIPKQSCKIGKVKI